ncbi:heme peroxidase family protein [Pseudomonas sp. NPDC087639]|uniref:peroxidase family protein n=1 Tax=Pseudomonas sp. NPDC087639 TaxID=3364445 RepID=UPI003812B91B
MAHGTADFPQPNEDPLDIAVWDEFDYITPSIDQLGPEAFLPTSPATIQALIDLGSSMTVDGDPVDVDSTIPAPYTYLGQFIDHDITKTKTIAPGETPEQEISRPDFEPMPLNQARQTLRNERTSGFDLDCLYGLHPLQPDLEIPFSGDKFVIGSVTPFDGGLEGSKGLDNDLPRVNSPGTERHRKARIGDPRNDENVIVAQLHLAFLKFHNAVVDRGFAFDDARRLVTHHYQWVVVHDFLPRVCDRNVLNDVLNKGNRLYLPKSEKFIPFEFSVAGYRFGHSLVRKSYDFNENFLKQGFLQAEGTLDLMFRFSEVSGDLGGQDTLPSNWIIEWNRMLGDKALQIDSTLTSFLAALTNQTGQLNIMTFLARRNLLKGYLFKLPTGQALAELVLPQSEWLSPADIEAACRPRTMPGEVDQLQALRAGGFESRTPLWFYILAEAKLKGEGNRLGPLGSLIVCETMIGLLRANPNSILNVPFQPTFGTQPGHFDLQDLLMAAGVLSVRV